MGRLPQLLRITLVGAALAPLAVAVTVIRLLRPRRRGRPLRSLWSGDPIPTLGVKAATERLLGVDARSLVFDTTHLSAQFDWNLTRWRRAPGIGPFVPLVVFAWACWRFDRFHFFCSHGLLPGFRRREFNPWELSWLRFLGKELFFWTYGGDVRTQERTRSLPAPHACVECPAPGRFCICDDRAGRRNQERIARAATAVFAMGDMLEYVPGAIGDVFYWPVDLDAEGGARYAPAYPSPDGVGPVRIVHAANHRFFKGTHHLEAAVRTLEAEGLEVELVLVEGVPNDEALRLYRAADIVFDQCLIGFHGYFAQEAMALGKPVVCWIRRPDRDLLFPHECPIVNSPPDGLAAALRALATDRPRLRALGEQGRRYIEAHHTPRAFSRRLARAYAALGASQATP